MKKGGDGRDWGFGFLRWDAHLMGWEASGGFRKHVAFD